MRRSRTRKGDPVSAAICAVCQQVAQTPGGESIARLLVAPPTVPAEYAGTHEVCPACLDLRQRGDGHANRCELRLAGLRLQSGGWATGLSDFLRSDLRARRPKWTNIVATILAGLVAPFAETKGAILVPIPVSTGAGASDGLLKATLIVGERTGIPVLQAIIRNRRRSTRLSVAQVRRLIVEEEYRLDQRISSRWSERDPGR
jgi:hypothetical protein